MKLFDLILTPSIKNSLILLFWNVHKKLVLFLKMKNPLSYFIYFFSISLLIYLIFLLLSNYTKFLIKTCAVHTWNYFLWTERVV